MNLTNDNMLQWQRIICSQIDQAVDAAFKNIADSRDVVKQKDCADHFNVSVNTLKVWVAQGCPKIQLSTGMIMYSKKAVHQWLIKQQC